MERIKRALAEARRQRETLAEGSRVYSAQGDIGGGSGFAAARPAPAHPNRNARLWIGIVTAVIVVSMLASIIGVQYRKRSLDLAAFEVGTDMTGGSVSQSEESISTKQLREDLASLQAHVALVDESVIRLYNKLTEVHQRVEALAAAGTVAAAETRPTQEVQQLTADADTASQPGVSTVTAAVAVSAIESRVAEEAQPSAPAADRASRPADREQGLPAQQTPVAGTSDGPWVINLASFPDKPGAERFAARARAKDVAVEQNQVTVKGKSYWRVQATGFASAREARTQAGSLEATLGLKGTWVSRR